VAKNRRCQTAGLRFGPALKAFVFCALIGGSGIGYVWQKDQISRLGAQIKHREQRLSYLKEENEKKKKQLAELLMPKNLQMRIKELNLGLAEAQQSQIWRLREPLPATARTNPGEYASRGEGASPLE
jgi:hypothetical protein